MQANRTLVFLKSNLFNNHSLYPFLLGFFPILTLFDHNKTELFMHQLWLPIATTTVLTLVFFAVMVRIFRCRKKAALILAFFATIFFAYGHIADLLRFRIELADIVIGPNKVLFPLLIFLFILFAWKIKKSNADLNNISTILTVVAGFLVAYMSVGILVYQVNDVLDMKHNANYDRIKTASLVSQNLAIGYKPDIYYLIFDRYAREDSLKEYLGFNNHGIIKYLESKSFFVAHRSYANYPKTTWSLASSLNLRYLHYKNKSSSVASATKECLEDHLVQRFLSEQGYAYFHIGSWWWRTGDNRFADINYRYRSRSGLDGFDAQLLNITMLRILFRFSANPEWQDSQEAVAYALDSIKKAPTIKNKKPRFVFAHILLPHSPYVFDADGSELSESDKAHLTEKDKYLRQLEYANSEIKEIVTTILHDSKRPPIIIIQSDEGPIRAEDNDLGKFTKNLDENDKIKIHMRILNAYYFPGFDKASLYEGISPVNTFRLLFDYYFGTDFGLLKDYSYYVKDSEPKQLLDVTNIVQ